MATIVQSFEEGAYIITADGEEIPVYDGMEILPEDQLVGNIITLEVGVANDPGADPSVIAADDIAAIQQAILEGADPTQVAERTAAGGNNELNTDGGGTTFVSLDRTGTEIDPSAGYRTIPINLLMEQPTDEIFGLIEPSEDTSGTDPDLVTSTGPTQIPDGPNNPPESPDPEQPQPEPEQPENPEEPPVEEEPEEEDNSGQNNGWGNGDQDAPGNSEDNNQAENSDNNPPPGIINNPNLNTNEDEDSANEQDTGDTTETTGDGDNTDNLHDDNSVSSGDDVTDTTGQNPGNDKEVGNAPSDGNKGASNDDESPLDVKDLLDEEDDTIPGLGNDNPNAGPKGNNGWGNGDQDAPGNSLENNNAENNLDGLLSPTEQYYDN